MGDINDYRYKYFRKRIDEIVQMINDNEKHIEWFNRLVVYQLLIDALFFICLIVRCFSK